MKLTKLQEAIFTAGKYAGKAETYKFLMDNASVFNPYQSEYAGAAHYWLDKSQRYMKQLERELNNEQN